MDEEHNLTILSFNIRSGNSWLHPRFVVSLLNDLFGIHARAGCSCAGPYGHRLLHIGDEVSERYHKAIISGNLGIKPGWARASFHHLMDQDEMDFICEAIRFISEYGKYFLPLYSFKMHAGSWKHRTYHGKPAILSIEDALEKTHSQSAFCADCGEHNALRKSYLERAKKLASELAQTYGDG